MPLPPLTLLDDRYAIRRTLDDAHPFSRVYLGWSVKEERQVVIHEHFPSALVERAEDGLGVRLRASQDKARFEAGLGYFRKEAAVLSEVEHPSLPHTHPPLEAHGTAYRITAHHVGTPLPEALAAQGGRVSEQTALTLMRPVLEALGALHARGLIHGGLSPSAVFLTKSRRTLLTDFQCAYVQLARKMDALAGVVRAGTSPAEQYTPRGRQGPWTDVYAAAATIYRMVAGEDLPDALTRTEADPVPDSLRDHDAFSEGLRRALLQALAVTPKGRVQSVEAFTDLLSDPASTALVPAGTPGKTETQAEDATLDLAPVEAEERATEEAERRAAEGPSPAETDAASVEEARTPARTPQTMPTQPLRRLGRKKTALVAGAALLMLLLMGGSVLAVLGSGGALSPEERYAALRAEADSLFLHADYAAAERRYEEARALRPGASSAHVSQRLRRIEALRAAERDALYAASMEQADSLEIRARELLADGSNTEATRHYEAAMQVYLMALDNRPGDSLAFARVEALTDLTAEAAGTGVPSGTPSEKEAGAAPADPAAAAYARLRAEGDAAFDEGAFEPARQKYQAALAYRPADAYLTERIQEAGARLRDATRARTYTQSVRRADAFAQEGRYARARAAYEQALDARPGDATAQARLQELADREAEATENAEQYQYHRARGDVLFDEDRYAEAVESYQEALTYRPDDAHATDRLAASRAKLKAHAAGEKREADTKEGGAYTVVDQAPELIGGLAGLHRKVSYPARAARRGIEGRVTVRFVVTEDGRVREARVLKGIGGGADKEALRVIKEARFEPARLNGRAVPAWHALWVQFKLTK